MSDETALKQSQKRAEFAKRWLEAILAEKIGKEGSHGVIRLEIPYVDGILPRIRVADEVSYQ